MKNFSDLSRDEIAKLAKLTFRAGGFGTTNYRKTNIFTSDK